MPKPMEYLAYMSYGCHKRMNSANFDRYQVCEVRITKDSKGVASSRLMSLESDCKNDSTAVGNKQE